MSAYITYALIVAGVAGIIVSVWMLAGRGDMLGRIWAAATPLERGLLVVACLPVPGPLDEILGAYVAARVLRRLRQQGR